MARLRQVEIADIMDQEPLRCASCPTILEDHEKTYCRSCASYWEDVGNGLFDEIERPADGPERSSTMTMTPEQLREHKVLLARMGMIHTEPFGPTDMSAPEVQKRMREVIETTEHVPSIFDKQNDFDLANQVRMLTRDDSAHEGVVCSARNRIFKLSMELARLRTWLGQPAPIADGMRLKIVEVRGTAESGDFVDYLLADETASEGAILLGQEAIYCQVTDRLTAEIFRNAVNGFPLLFEAMRKIVAYDNEDQPVVGIARDALRAAGLPLHLDVESA